MLKFSNTQFYLEILQDAFKLFFFADETVLFKDLDLNGFPRDYRIKTTQI